MQVNRNIIYGRKKHPFTGYPTVKHPKRSKFAITNIREKPVNFFNCSTRAPILVSAITLLTQVSLQKFPFLFISIIPWITRLYFWELWVCGVDNGSCGTSFSAPHNNLLRWYNSQKHSQSPLTSCYPKCSEKSTFDRLVSG